MSIENEIKEIVNRETKAWSDKNIQLLMSIFHPDMVWVWPTDSKNLDPVSWALPQGKFDEVRYSKIYSSWFNNFEIIRNDRRTVKILISGEGDGAFAVVDIDTLWRSKEGQESHWFGRTGKTYAKTPMGWKMINQVGVFDFGAI
jgi:ketosteroid isomerase-like protein